MVEKNLTKSVAGSCNGFAFADSFLQNFLISCLFLSFAKLLRHKCNQNPLNHPAFLFLLSSVKLLANSFVRFCPFDAKAGARMMEEMHFLAGPKIEIV